MEHNTISIVGAKENNLNFIEFWNLKEVEEWLNQNNQ